MRSILITGCSSGIGYHAAHAMKARGWQVFATCRRPADVERLRAEGLASERLDYADSSSIAAALGAVLAATGSQLDALYNNGAYTLLGAIEDVPTDDLRAVLEANFIGWHDLTRRVIPVMRAQKSGRIVNCSSVLGFTPVRFSGAYVASKHALEGWTDVLRLELAGTGIGVSLIEPGPITTGMAANARDKHLASVGQHPSVFRERYEAVIRDFDEGRYHSIFERGPEAVTRALIRAVESRWPRHRYRVTLPAHLAAISKRLVGTRILDWFHLRLR